MGKVLGFILTHFNLPETDIAFMFERQLKQLHHLSGTNNSSDAYLPSSF